MNTRYIAESEITARQQHIRESARAARHTYTIAGLRHLIGSTFIAFGTRLYGRVDLQARPQGQPSEAALQAGLARSI